MARHFRGPGPRRALHRVHGRRAHERLAPGRRRAGGGDRRGHRRASCRSSRCRPATRGEVAERYRYRDGSGEIGVIASVTRPFCGACTRARLSADGSLYTCLFATTGHDLRALVRGDAGDDEIAAALGGIWRERADRYSELRSSATPDLPKVEMSYIGG